MGSYISTFIPGSIPLLVDEYFLWLSSAQKSAWTFILLLHIFMFSNVQFLKMLSIKTKVNLPQVTLADWSILLGTFDVHAPRTVRHI